MGFGTFTLAQDLYIASGSSWLVYLAIFINGNP
jgi:hypothetical protein